VTRTLFVLTVFIFPAIAQSAGFPPWQFGMSKEQVKSFSQFGPYKTFSNGDLETFNGLFHGRKENIQFFFANDRLRRIGVYLYEGTDRKGGIEPWRRLYELLQKDYGEVESPDIKVDSKGGPIPAQVLAIAAAANADITGQTVIRPAKQPNDMRVFARFSTGNVQGKKWYYVAVLFDRG
jgi:hypothetical protein